MSYNPQAETLDFEIGAFGDRLKKGFKKATKVLDKVTHATITKPSMMIGKAIGGKKGEAWGKKLGGITSMATKVGVGAGAAGALAPILTGPTAITALTAGAAGKIGKKVLGKKKKKVRVKAKGTAKTKASAKKKKSPGFIQKKKSSSCDNKQAAKVAALLVEKLGKPLASANKHLKLAELQRQATYEHNKLMTDSEFRKKVLGAITTMAASGDLGCERTIRVLVGR